MNTYSEVIDWLFQQFPAYQNLGAGAYKPDLHNIEKLLQALDNPHHSLKCIHIAGTNGKGSTSHITSSIVQSAGYKVGLFTSPHLVDFRERIKVNGIYIPENDVVDWVNTTLRNINLDYAPSFFELTFAMAMDYFRQQKCDYCVIEVGLGGRLDATNIIHPLITVITNIGIDHQQFLGETRALIAHEKAGIIKPMTPVVVCQKDEETQAVFENKARENNARLIWVENQPLHTDLIGSFQQLNANTALTTLNELKRLELISLTEDQIQTGLLNVKRNTNFMGRMDIISTAPLTIIDGAHNKEGVKALLANFENTANSLHIVYGASNDKDISEIVNLFPAHANIYFTEFNHPRSCKIDDFRNLTRKSNTNPQLFSTAKEALSQAQSSAKKEDTVLVFGSLFLISEFF